MEEELKSILREVFGYSSSESDGESSYEQGRVNGSTKEILCPPVYDVGGQIWETIAEIEGLSICRDFLSADQQSSLLSDLESEGYLSEASHNQAMRFGNLPIWAIRLSHLIHELSGSMGSRFACNDRKGACLFPSELLSREPLFNQLIVNIYQPHEGICAHVDLMRFEDGIAVVSLESSCVMHFTPVDNFKDARIPVLLTPGSLVLMCGEARYRWKHEINRKPGGQIWEGQEINQTRRVSITLRKLRPME